MEENILDTSDFLYTFLAAAQADIGVAELSIDVAVSGK